MRWTARATFSSWLGIWAWVASRNAPVDLNLAHASPEQLPERVRSLLEYLEVEVPREIQKLDLDER